MSIRPLPAPMEKSGSLFSHLVLLFLSLLLLTQFSNQLSDSQSQAIINIQKLLSRPLTITSLDKATDFCNGEPNSYMRILCYEDSIMQVHFHGADGLPSLPSGFSMEALFEALVALPNLKVVTLVSLGLWGPLPPHIGNCSSLEILNLSSNLLTGSIPVEIVGLESLQTLILDHNMLTGQIPTWLSPQRPSLTVLSLKNNSLSGPLPSSFSNLENLKIIQLFENNFSGPLPELSSLTNLQSLDVGGNSFGPQLPKFPNKLVTLILKRNMFRFGMINNLTSFSQLQRLDLSANEIVGRIPSSILSFPSISYLDISGNRLTGLLQENMSCGAQLKSVDLSSNILTGNLPSCLLRKSRKMVVKYRKNCLSNGHLRAQHHFAFCRNEALAVKVNPPKERKRGPPASKSVVAMSSVGAISLVGLVLLVTRILFARHKFKKPQTRLILEEATPKYTSRQFSAAREICQMMKLGPLGLPAYRNFLLEEIKEATENFDKPMLISEGSLDPVYKGKLANETIVAIRSLKMRKKRGIQTYTHHIELLSKLRHSQLVSALGHCFECHQDDSSVSRIHLVFEYVPHGTLRDSISAKLSWPQRILAAIGVAKGIQFLQTGIIPGLFANKIKITDVLLDHSLHVKINRYNLPLLAENREPVLPRTQSKEKVKAMSKQDEKSDVYDFGVILLEIVTGRAITSENEAQVVRDLFQVGLKVNKIARRNVVDPAVSKGCSDLSLKTLMELSVKCLSSERPSIEDVLWNLQFAAQIQDSWQLGDSPSTSKGGTPIYLSR